MENSAHRMAVDCIYEALVILMETKPYKEITITDITRKAGVSRMAYYRNYQDKDDILIDHLREQLEEATQVFLQKRIPLMRNSGVNLFCPWMRTPSMNM